MSFRKILKMTLLEAAIQVKYRGMKQFAIVEIDADGGAGASPLISLGVSDTSLAQAVTNMVTVFTGTTTSEMRDIVANIANGSGGTIDADDDIKIGDFMCRLKNSIESDDAYHATVDMFSDDAGATTNFRSDEWEDTLLWVNDATSVGACRLKVPQPEVSEGGVGIESIAGASCDDDGTTVTTGIKRSLLDKDGNVLWTISHATLARGDTDTDKDWGALVVFDNGPHMFKDECIDTAQAAEFEETNGVVTYGMVEHNLA